MFGLSQSKPKLSIVVIFYEMAREGPRTLLSMVPPFQQNLEGIDYEIIGIEHGSRNRLQVPDHPELKTRLKMITLDEAPVSPVKAINQAVRDECRGEFVMIYIDGARLASTHLLHQSLAASHGLKNPFVAALSWHIGPDIQSQSVQAGYNQSQEDRLLADIDWYNQGDRLFEISVFAGSSKFGYFHEIAETNCPVLRRERFVDIGGYNEGFVSAGGGLANLEFFRRCVEKSDNTTVTLIGDGTFHQYHGGASTSHDSYFENAKPEHVAATGYPYDFPVYRTYYFGRKSNEARKALEASLNRTSFI